MKLFFLARSNDCKLLMTSSQKSVTRSLSPLGFWILCLNQARSWGTTWCWPLWNRTLLDAVLLQLLGILSYRGIVTVEFMSLTRLLLSISHKSSFVTLALVSVAEARELCLVTSWSGWLPADWDTPLTVIYNRVGRWQWDVCETVVHRFLNTYSKVFSAGCRLVS